MKISNKKVDLPDSEAVENVAQHILSEVGAPDILINKAGSGRWKFLTDTSAEKIEQVMALPYFSAAWITRLFLPEMLKRGSRPRAVIQFCVPVHTWLDTMRSLCVGIRID